MYTPWCINCETISKHVERLAKHFKGLDNLVFARVDASGNEHPKLQVSVIIFAWNSCFVVVDYVQIYDIPIHLLKCCKR